MPLEAALAAASFCLIGGRKGCCSSWPAGGAVPTPQIDSIGLDGADFPMAYAPGQVAPGRDRGIPSGTAAYNAPHSPLQATKADYDALPQIGDHPLRVYAAMIRNLDRNVGRVLPHGAIFWRSVNYRAIRETDWKLQVDDTRRKPWLYNLADDPTEQHDLAASAPDKAAELAAVLAKIDAEQSKPLWPALIEVPVLIDKPLGQKMAETDEYIYWSN